MTKETSKNNEKAPVEKTVNASNSKRFIDTFNRLDRAVRDIYNLKPSLGFSDAIRRASSMHYVIKKYEDDLIDFGRLRNAIVHRSSDIPIAEPHDDVVEKFEKIERLVSTPPLVLNTDINRTVVSVDGEKTTVGMLVKDMFKTGYSNIPVYKEKTLIGVVNRKMILDSFGRALINNKTIDSVLNSSVVDALEIFSVTSHYEVVSEKSTIDQILFLFQQNKKLSTVIITKNGNYSAEPLGIVVTADLIDMQSILDNY